MKYYFYAYRVAFELDPKDPNVLNGQRLEGTYDGSGIYECEDTDNPIGVMANIRAKIFYEGREKKRKNCTVFIGDIVITQFNLV